MAKQCKYASSKGGNDVEELSERLANDLRHHIRTLGHFPLLSDNWCEMADVLGRVAAISDVESKLSAGKDDATLWETEEAALRFLIEDGKLNLCLRNLVEYKAFQRNSRTSNNIIATDKQEKCDKFEKGLGTVLRNAWSHVEAIQTTDLQLLVNHIGDVLEFANDHPSFIEDLYLEEDLAQRQEVVVFNYINGLMKQMDNLYEGRVMPLMRERHIFMNGVRFLSAHHDKLQSGPILVVIEALSALADSEDFSTFKDEYVVDATDASDLMALSESCLVDYKKNMAHKRMMRPLTDLVMQMKRRHHLK